MNEEDLKTPPCIAEAVKPAIAAFIRNLDDLVESRPWLRPYVFRFCRFLERRDKEYFPMQEGFLGGWFRHDGDMGTVTLGDCRRLFADADGLRLSWIWSHGIRVAVVHGPDDGDCAAEAIREHPEDWGVLQDLFAGHRRGTGLGLGHAGEDALLALLAATAAKRGLYLSAMDWSYATNHFVPDEQGWPTGLRMASDPMEKAGLREAFTWLRPSCIMDMGKIAHSPKYSEWFDEINDLEAEYNSRGSLQNEGLYSDGEYLRMRSLFAVPHGVPLAPLPAPEDESLQNLSWRYHPLRDLSRAVAADPSLATRRGVAEEGTGDFWRTVLFHEPRLSPICPGSRFDADDWQILLSVHPELEHHPDFRWRRLEPRHIVDLLRANPKLADVVPVDWTRLDGVALSPLLCEQPRLLDDLSEKQFERMATCDSPLSIEGILDWNPELVDHPHIRRFLKKLWREDSRLCEALDALRRLCWESDFDEQDSLHTELWNKYKKTSRLRSFLEEDDRFRKHPFIKKLIRKHRRKMEDEDDEPLFVPRPPPPSPPSRPANAAPADTPSEAAPDTGAGWVDWLRAHPEDGADCEWGKLGATDWIRLLSSNPEWAWRPEWRRLVPKWNGRRSSAKGAETTPSVPRPAPSSRVGGSGIIWVSMTSDCAKAMKKSQERWLIFPSR